MKYHERINIAEIISGDEPEGKTHLRAFVSAVNAGEQPTPETMNFLTEAFTAILKGIEPKSALHLKKRPGDNADAHMEQHLVWAVMVEEKRLQGMGKDEARKAVAEETRKSFKRIREHHLNHKVAAKAMIEAFQKFDALKAERRMDKD